MNKSSILGASVVLLCSLMGANATASQYSKSARIAFGPSLNKDTPAPSGSSSAPAAQGTVSSSAPATIMPTMPTTPATPPPQVTTQPLPPPTSMERASAIARSVLQKVDPAAKSILHRDGVDLSRSNAPPTVNGNAAPPSAAAAAAAVAAANAPPAANASAASSGTAATATAQNAAPLNTSMNKQERKVSAQGSGEVRQLQRGILNEQKVNVGTIQ